MAGCAHQVIGVACRSRDDMLVVDTAQVLIAAPIIELVALRDFNATL